MNFLILSLLLLFSHSVLSDSLWPHGLQHARPPCPSPTPRTCSNSCLLSQWCHLTISSSLGLFSFPSIRVFSSESAVCTRWPKHWSFSFNINPSNEYSGLISFKIGWFDLLAVQAEQLTTSSAISLGFPCGSPGRESTCNAGDLSSIPGLGRSPGEGYPQQYSGLENSMDCIVYGVTKSRTRLNGFHSLQYLHPHSSAYHLPSLDIWNSRIPVGNVQILTTPFGPLWKSSSLDPKRK